MSEIKIRKNEANHRFEAEVDGKLAVLDYMPAGPTQIAYVHTEVPPELAGQGVGSALAQYAMEYAQQNDLRVLPTCPFIIAYLRRHPEYQALVVAGPRA